MKSAEEWAKAVPLNGCSPECTTGYSDFIEIVKQIQQDAFAAGRDAALVEAAELLKKKVHFTRPNCVESYSSSPHNETRTNKGRRWKVNAKEFESLVGREPQGDDLERVNCKHAGEISRPFCGLCEKCGKPRFICGHVKGTSTDIHDNTDL